MACCATLCEVNPASLLKTATNMTNMSAGRRVFVCYPGNASRMVSRFLVVLQRRLVEGKRRGTFLLVFRGNDAGLRILRDGDHHRQQYRRRRLRDGGGAAGDGGHWLVLNTKMAVTDEYDHDDASCNSSSPPSSSLSSLMADFRVV